MTDNVGAPVDAAVAAAGLRKVYGDGGTAVVALNGVDVTFQRGRFTAIMGPSGSGKSLLYCLAGLEEVTGGRVVIGGAELAAMSDDQLTRLRRDRVGFVFQAYNLVPTLNALENITLPLDLAGRAPDRELLDAVIGAVGLRERLRHRPTQLSGGQQQRVACARALVARPEIVFADEPTGNLDSRAGSEVLALLRGAVDDIGQTVAMVTHDPASLWLWGPIAALAGVFPVQATPHAVVHGGHLGSNAGRTASMHSHELNRSSMVERGAVPTVDTGCSAMVR